LAAVADGATLLVDDVDLIDDAAVLDGIESAVRSARDRGGFVVLAGTTETMSASFRGPIAQARRARSGLLLRPEGPHDGELLGVRLRRRTGHTDPPGRGVFALHGRVVPVQVPDPA
jgi:S-DNA-T family DNA segregation ATPase FtsK/SpoIIIE